MSDLAEFLRARLDEWEEVLLDVESKQLIIQECAYWLEHDPLGTGAPDGLAAKVLRLLALPYAGHPDYRKEWAP